MRAQDGPLPPIIEVGTGYSWKFKTKLASAAWALRPVPVITCGTESSNHVQPQLMMIKSCICDRSQLLYRRNKGM